MSIKPIWNLNLTRGSSISLNLCVVNFRVNERTYNRFLAIHRAVVCFATLSVKFITMHALHMLNP
jgi:hypothetical protein